MGKQFVFLFPEGSHTMERWASGHIIQIYQCLTIFRQTESWQSYNPLYLAKLCSGDEEVHWLSIVLILVITRVSGWSIAV